MPVDFLHAIIAVIFFAVWIVISQIAFGPQSRDPQDGVKSPPGSHLPKGHYR